MHNHEKVMGRAKGAPVVPRKQKLPRRRCLGWRISLRTLLLLLTVLAVTLGIRQIRIQKHINAMDAILSKRAQIQGDYLDFVGPDFLWSGSFQNPQTLKHYYSRYNARFLHYMEKLGLATPGGTSCEMWGPSCGSREIQMLGSLLHLKNLALLDITLTAEDLQSIADLGELEYLSVHNCMISDEDLPYLCQFKQLKELWLAGSELSNDGLAELRECLRNCEISL